MLEEDVTAEEMEKAKRFKDPLICDECRNIFEFVKQPRDAEMPCPSCGSSEVGWILDWKEEETEESVSEELTPSDRMGYVQIENDTATVSLEERRSCRGEVTVGIIPDIDNSYEENGRERYLSLKNEYPSIRLSLPVDLDVEIEFIAGEWNSSVDLTWDQAREVAYALLAVTDLSENG